MKAIRLPAALGSPHSWAGPRGAWADPVDEATPGFDGGQPRPAAHEAALVEALRAFPRRHGLTDAAARTSLHAQGRAIDVRLPDVALADLRDAACELGVGGVGYYPRERFVYLDTGRVRRW